MLEILPAPDHVVAMKLSGVATSNDYDRIIATVEAKLAAHDCIGLYCDLEGFEDITAHAIAKDLRYTFGKLGELKRFPRAAIVTRKDWLRTLVKMWNPVLPRIEMRAFDPADRDAALLWVGEHVRGAHAPQGT